MANSFLGTGWSFPPTFDSTTNAVIMTSDVADIQLSLQILFSTSTGERVMVPDYGCDLDQMLFEPITTTLKTHIVDMISKAILHYEARIDVNSITIDDTQAQNGLITIMLDYTVRTTNSRFNFVYPYYLNEGTDLNS